MCDLHSMARMPKVRTTPLRRVRLDVEFMNLSSTNRQGAVREIRQNKVA